MGRSTALTEDAQNRRNPRWSKEDDDTLLRLREGNMPYEEIVKQLRVERTVLACRLHYLQLRRRMERSTERNAERRRQEELARGRHDSAITFPVTDVRQRQSHRSQLVPLLPAPAHVSPPVPPTPAQDVQLPPISSGQPRQQQLPSLGWGPQQSQHMPFHYQPAPYAPQPMAPAYHQPAAFAHQPGPSTYQADQMAQQYGTISQVQSYQQFQDYRTQQYAPHLQQFGDRFGQQYAEDDDEGEKDRRYQLEHILTNR